MGMWGSTAWRRARLRPLPRRLALNGFNRSGDLQPALGQLPQDPQLPLQQGPRPIGGAGGVAGRRGGLGGPGRGMGGGGHG